MVVDSHTREVVKRLRGHRDYAFASGCYPGLCHWKRRQGMPRLGSSPWPTSKMLSHKRVSGFGLVISFSAKSFHFKGCILTGKERDVLSYGPLGSSSKCIEV